MAYTAKTWVDNSAPSVCAANLNDLETGVADAHTTADGAVAKGVLQAKGDLFAALSASSPTRVVVGADNTVLVADSAQTHGLKWVQIGNAQVLAAAAIAYSKLDLASSIVNTDVGAGAAIAYSKLALAGSIVNADIASSASISAPKIAGFPADSAKFLRGDATWAAPAAGGGATSATSVTALGAATDGKIGLIRAGSTPFDFQEVIYDSTYAKWVSPSIKIASHESNGQFLVAATGGAYADAGGVDNYAIVYKPFTDAGLSLQLKYLTDYASGANDGTVYITIGYRTEDTGDTTSFTMTASVALESSQAGSTTYVIRTKNWTDIDTFVAKAWLRLTPMTKKSAGTGSVRVGIFHAWARWVG